MKDHLIFDTTSAATMADTDSVGAYVRASDGTLITATGTALDVNIDNASIEVTATDLDIRDLDFNSDSVTAHQGGTWTIDSITNPVTVTATDLDIRDLDSTTDSVASWLYDSAGNGISSTDVGGKQSLDVNVTSGINVEVDLSHVDDSVALGDGTSLFTSTTVGSDIGLDVNVINDPSTANTAIANAANQLTVADTAEDVVASPLANRKYLYLYNEGNRKVFVGATGVSAANGFPLSPGSYLELRAGAAVDVEFVGQSGASGASASLRTLELS